MQKLTTTAYLWLLTTYMYVSRRTDSFRPLGDMALQLFFFFFYLQGSGEASRSSASLVVFTAGCGVTSRTLAVILSLPPFYFFD